MSPQSAGIGDNQRMSFHEKKETDGYACENCGHLNPVPSGGQDGPRRRFPLLPAAVLAAFIFGLVAGGLFYRPPVSRGARSAPTVNREATGVPESADSAEPSDADVVNEKPPARSFQSLMAKIHPEGGYALPASYGDIGPQLLEVGAIDYERFIKVYERAGQPLTEAQKAVLTEGSTGQIVIDQENAYFLLNFFWAFGLANENPLLEEGPLVQYSRGDVGGYASTGGWTIGEKPAKAFLSSAAIVQLTPEQQERVERVASQVYRPCCDNPTHFPDCNHGMAMLGLLELMAAQGASDDEMFRAAKYINAYWYPQQTLEVATFFAVTEDTGFFDANARKTVSRELFSGSGFRALHQWLAENGLLQQSPNQGGSCGV
jgi:hypothetical protein